MFPEAAIESIKDSSRLRDMARSGVRRGFQMIVAGGGDGTINTVAGEVLRHPVTLGILPLGTFNHFAKDLGLPLDLSRALEALRDGQAVPVDVGEVNGHVFVNNASLGLYPRLAKMREKHRRRGWRRASAFFWAAVATLRRYPFLQVKLNVDEQPIDVVTPLVFVGNNVYQMTGLRAGSRASVSKGELCVCLAPRARRLDLLYLGVLALFGRLQHAPGFRMFCTSKATIETPHRHVRVATDGEVTWMLSPLRFRVHPGALRVMLPR